MQKKYAIRTSRVSGKFVDNNEPDIVRQLWHVGMTKIGKMYNFFQNGSCCRNDRSAGKYALFVSVMRPWPRRRAAGFRTGNFTVGGAC
jgi:hypothetical protein